MSARSWRVAPYNLLSHFEDKYLIIVFELVKFPSGVYKRGRVGIGDSSFKSAYVYLGTSVTFTPKAEITLFIFL